MAVEPKIESKNLKFQFALQQSMSNKTAFVSKDAVSKWSVKPDELSTSPVLQVDNTFLVTQTNNNLLIIDQHAAHERILYEQFIYTFNSKSVKRKVLNLKRPIKVEFPVGEAAILDENIEVLGKLGFSIEKVDGSYLVNKIPDIYSGHSIHQLLSELIEDIANVRSKTDSLTQRTLSFLACRSAIKAGDELSEVESKRLLEKLYRTKTNYTCPHGRPVLIEIPLSQLHIAFRRK